MDDKTKVELCRRMMDRVLQDPIKLSRNELDLIMAALISTVQTVLEFEEDDD